MRSNQIPDDVGTSMQSGVQLSRCDRDGSSPEGLNHKKRILIVDDDPRNVKLLAARLPQKDYKTISAYGGKSALKVVMKEAPDLILLDVLMPDVTGYEVTKRLKNEPSTRNIPIILVTSLNGPEEKTKGLKAGADDFLTKPVHHAELITRIRSLLRLKEYQEKTEPTTRPQESITEYTMDEEEKGVPSILFDKLSGLYTRDYFDQQLNLEIKRSLRQRYSITLMMVHIDILEMDDDSFGDLTRNQIINQYGQVIKRCIRGEDFAAYYSDKEFAALLPYFDNNYLGSIVKRIQKAVNDHHVFPQGSSDRLAATASLGFACCPSDACTAERLIQRAVAALHQAQRE